MNLNLRQFHAFVAVAHLGSFTRAARLLNLSQPALTVQVRQLEETIGVRLFDRSTRMVKLTPIGRELAPRLERVLHEIDAVMVNTRELASHIKGTVTIGALPSLSSNLIPSTIAEFQKQYPGIVVKLRDVLANLIVRLVKDEEVDFGIGTLRVPDPDIQFTPLLTDNLGVIFPAGHPVEHRRIITLKYLTAFPLILMDPETSVRDRWIMRSSRSERSPFPRSKRSTRPPPSVQPADFRNHLGFIAHLQFLHVIHLDPGRRILPGDLLREGLERPFDITDVVHMTVHIDIAGLHLDSEPANPLHCRVQILKHIVLYLPTSQKLPHGPP